MPGLIRGVARTAVIAGTATHVSNNVSRRQANRWAEKDQQAQADAYAQQQYQQAQYAQQAPPPQQVVYAAPPAAAPQVDIVAELTKLGDLKASGVLSDAEFEAAKAKLLAG
ncbi:MAG TPA: SHOCT domain-containing protein [Candidatus Nanopelagicales bacterium]